MDGIELLKNCRQHPDNQCFIVLSCFNEYLFVREARKLGALDYLFKPLMEGPDIEKVIMEAKEQLGFSSRSSEAAEHQNAVRTKLKEIIENGVSANISQMCIRDRFKGPRKEFILPACCKQQLFPAFLIADQTDRCCPNIYSQ